MNMIMNMDSYKMAHGPLYPKGTNAISSYVEARTENDIIVPFGRQKFLKQYLMNPITLADVDEAESLIVPHGLPFDRSALKKIVNVYDGFAPVTIRGVREGTVTKSREVLDVIECEDPDIFWFASALETAYQRAIWFPTTIASNDFINRCAIQRMYDKSSDDHNTVPFALHSFGSRGVECAEAAAIGGLAHLVYFQGTDDLIALKAAKDYYNATDPVGFSVVATEHSVQCAYGNDNQAAYLDAVLDTYGKPGAIVSVVMDGYSIYREVELLCTPYFVDKIKRLGCKFVVRPDSGDPKEIIPWILDRLNEAFGSRLNSKGYIVLNNVGVIQGDGIDQRSLVELMNVVESHNYAAENVIYGSGGGLLQKVNRDTFKFAQKTSAIRIGDRWIDTVKDPITDQGKRSKSGRQGLDLDVIFENGKLLIDENFETIRKRAIDGLNEMM